MPAPRAAGPAFFFASCNRKSAFDIRQLRCGSRARDFIDVLLVRGHSSVGRAPALQAGSQGFESPCLQSLQGVEATSTNREHFRITSGSVIPLPPVFVRAVVQSEDCHAVALAKAEMFKSCNGNAASYDSASQRRNMAKFFYIYILQSERDEDRFYTGLTDDPRKRLRNHNAGRVLYTAKWRPWRVKAYVALSDRVRAASFERFSNRHLGGRSSKNIFKVNSATSFQMH